MGAAPQNAFAAGGSQPSPKQAERIMQLAGAWKNDPYHDEMLGEVFRERNRPMVEETT